MKMLLQILPKSDLTGEQKAVYSWHRSVDFHLASMSVKKLPNCLVKEVDGRGIADKMECNTTIQEGQRTNKWEKYIVIA